MDAPERNRRVSEQKERLVSGLEAHIAALEELATTTNFDFDVATDIHPHLLDDTSAGREQLKKWQELYSVLQEGPKSLITFRWINGLADGCYGFGAPEKYETKQAWLHVYEDISADNIEFIKGDRETPSQIVINKPHDTYEWNSYKISSVSETDAENAVLYEQRVGSMKELFKKEGTEPFAGNESFVYGETLLDSTRDMEKRLDNPADNVSLNVRISASDFLVGLIREQLKEARRNTHTS